MRETRQFRADLRATRGSLVGYAAVFNVPSKDLGGFIEKVKPGAFARVLREGVDVRGTTVPCASAVSFEQN